MLPNHSLLTNFVIEWPHSRSSHSLKIFLEFRKDPMQIFLFTILVILCSLTLVSCSDFVDSPTTTPAPTVSNEQPNPSPEKPSETTQQKPLPAQTIPVGTPSSSVKRELNEWEAQEKRNWRLCEAERRWAFQTGLIDESLLKLYQLRNFAPVFYTRGVRQSGIEGWYVCKRALQMNGFIALKSTVNDTVYE